MRPVSVALDGFSSYSEPQTVDFEGVGLACITGHNGAGKTSLFDSIAFALFGDVSRGDIDSIVNDACESAEVAFTFDHGSERYRVTRTRVRGKKTSARIERLVDGEFDTFEASGVRAVDSEIAKLVRISPETFTATVLMGQEDSGRFARANPAERKQILSEILGLDQYQTLAKSARDQARIAAREPRHLPRPSRRHRQEPRRCGRSNDGARPSPGTAQGARTPRRIRSRRAREGGRSTHSWRGSQDTACRRR